jgi:hypothetical protein
MHFQNNNRNDVVGVRKMFSEATCQMDIQSMHI